MWECAHLPVAVQIVTLSTPVSASLTIVMEYCSTRSASRVRTRVWIRRKESYTVED